jgi:hypothetical protein
VKLPESFICAWCHQRIASYGIGGYHLCPAMPDEYREGK